MDLKKTWTQTGVMLLAGFFSLLLSSQGVGAQKNKLAVGGAFPLIKFDMPAASEDCKYLGLNESDKEFTLPQINAKVVVLEVFNLYCPHCQAEAPNVNELVKNVASAGLNDKIKFLGFGAGNSTFEVKAFREKYKVAFPLLPDPKLRIYHRLCDEGTPFFIALKLRVEGGSEIFYCKSGPLPKIDEFLEEIKKQALLQ